MDGPYVKDLFKTCNVLPFSCTHLAWCLQLKTKLIGQHNGRKTPIHEILYPMLEADDKRKNPVLIDDAGSSVRHTVHWVQILPKVALYLYRVCCSFRNFFTLIHVLDSGTCIIFLLTLIVLLKRY